MAEGGLPDGMWVHGATGSQYQLPKVVPEISSTLTMTKMAANSGQRGDRRRKYANTGRHNAPWTSMRPVAIGSTVRPRAAHAPATARTA